VRCFFYGVNKNYVNLPFVDEDKKEMKRWVEGGMIAHEGKCKSLSDR